MIAAIRRGHIQGRMRHVRIALSYAFDALRYRAIRLFFCPTDDMKANFLTKSEPAPLFKTSLAFLFPE